MCTALVSAASFALTPQPGPAYPFALAMHLLLFLTQASQEVSKAGAIDYVATPEERAQHALERPLDRYLMPLATSLALRTYLTQVSPPHFSSVLLGLLE